MKTPRALAQWRAGNVWNRDEGDKVRSYALTMQRMYAVCCYDMLCYAMLCHAML